MLAGVLDADFKGKVGFLPHNEGNHAQWQNKWKKLRNLYVCGV